MTIPSTGPTHQQRVDAIQAQLRKTANDGRILLPEPGRAGSAPRSADRLDTQLAQELDHARRMLDAIGDRLVADPGVLERHADTLQGFDVIGQVLGHIADVVGADDSHAAVDRIGMQDLRKRLTRRG